MANLFERLNKSRPPAQLEKKDQDHHKRRDEEAFVRAQRLLDFITQKWAKPTICLRDIYIFGPYLLQNEKEAALEAAEILASRGWLIAQKSDRHDRHVWEIPRRPILQPTVTRTPL